MKFSQSIFLAAIGLIGATSALQAQAVAKPDARLAALAAADALLEIKVSPVPADAIDPFNSVAFSEAMGMTRAAPTEGPAPAGPRSDREILAAIAASLRPSGNFVLGGQQTLIFGQKRVKAGMPLTINFEGTEYTLEITAIDRANFTLRLNREEITRPIK